MSNETVESIQGKMYICPKCGKIKPNDDFCLNCCVSTIDCNCSLEKWTQMLYDGTLDKWEKTKREELGIYNNTQQYPVSAKQAKQNTLIGSWLKILSLIILIFGTIGSIVIATNTETGFSNKNDFSFTAFLIYEFATVVLFSLFLGLSEIIKLLFNIEMNENTK